MDFVDNQINPNTGTIKIRCVVPNPEGKLISGLYVRMKVPGSERYSTVLVPDSGVGTDQSNRFLLVVGADDTVEFRPVKLGALFGTLRGIADGLKPEERVIVAGLQAARPGSKVVPTETPIAEAALRQIVALNSTGAASETVAAGEPPASNTK